MFTQQTNSQALCLYLWRAALIIYLARYVSHKQIWLRQDVRHLSEALAFNANINLLRYLYAYALSFATSMRTIRYQMSSAPLSCVYRNSVLLQQYF